MPGEGPHAPAPVGAGRVSDGSSGPPLILNDSFNDTITLTWGSSCSAEDQDYAVYQGIIGDFTSHVPLTCTTAGKSTLMLVPQAGDLYYLVVPTTINAEGSYGREGDGTERPASASPCAPQGFASCQ